MEEVLWPLQPATAAKHRLYQRYLDAWWAKLLQPAKNAWLRPRVTYVDAFAGPGRYAGGEPGSPLFVLERLLNHKRVREMQLRPDRVHLVFIEKDRRRYDHLVNELASTFGPLDKLPVTVVVRHGDAGDLTRPTLTGLRAWTHPILAIFDSWGNVNVPLNVVAKIAGNKSSEVIVTFGPNWFSRRETEDPDELDLVFGGRDHWRPSDPAATADERWRTWLTTYRDALRRAGFPWQLQFMVTPGSGAPLYLVYGTAHPSGVEVMKDAMWSVDTSDGLSFRDPRVRGAPPLGQAPLWDAPDLVDDELLELVRQHLLEKPGTGTTLEEVGTWLLLETSRWKAMHARGAVERLRDDGQVRIEPTGRRITKASVIRLVPTSSG